MAGVKGDNPDVLYRQCTVDAIMQPARKAQGCKSLRFWGILQKIKAKNLIGSLTKVDLYWASIALFREKGVIGQMYTFFPLRTVDVELDFFDMDGLSSLITVTAWRLVMAS